MAIASDALVPRVQRMHEVIIPHVKSVLQEQQQAKQSKQQQQVKH